MSTELNIGFDYSHENRLVIEDPGFNDFIEFLFNSDFKLGKIQAGLTIKKLSKYNLFIIGVPTSNSFFTEQEINDVIEYVRAGGSLLLINDKGGDKANHNNLSELSKFFGIKFNPDVLHDDKNYSKKPSRPVITSFKKHFITRDINRIIHSGGCTLTIENLKEIPELDIKPLAFSSNEHAWHEIYDGTNWVKKPVKKAPILAAGHFGSGKIVAIGNLSIFSNLNDEYGIRAADNFKLISNIVSWLLNKAHSESSKKIQPIYCAFPIKQELYYWMRDKIEEGKWKSIDEIINFALKVIKIRMTKQDDVKEDDDLS
ncbi:MAG: hypothetical protein ACTSUX_02415 [Promethearchaeota archaeon]